jgi:hypothetical protein
MLIGEELRRDAVKIISFRPEVIVDHIKNYHQPARMSGVDQRLQIVRTAIGRVRSKQQHAVVAPVPAAREIGNRHQFERGDTGLRQMIEMIHHCAEGAGLRESADVTFDKYRAFPRQAFPVPRPPSIARVIDHLARPAYILGLAVRGRVGNIEFAVDIEHVARAVAGLSDMQFKPAAALFHVERLVELELDRTRGRSPQPEGDAGVGDERSETRG